MASVLPQLILNGILLGGVYSLISIGLTLIFGVTRIVNFAHGEFLMLAMYATFWLNGLRGVDPYLCVILVVPLLFLSGLIAHRLVIHPILGAPSYIQIFATVGLSVTLQNVALFLWTADFRSVDSFCSNTALQAGVLVCAAPKLIAFAASGLTTVALHLFLKRTYLGKAIRAVVQDREAAQLMGINIHRIYLFTFGLGAACVGVAGALMAPIYTVFPTVGVYFVLTAFVVVVLGGLGSLPGAFLGGLIIGVVESLAGFFISPQLKEGIYFLIFLAVLLVRPSGLFGQIGGEELG
jgi:branched-chain amino acid transport system permease protein